MNLDFLSRVNIIAVGVERYLSLRPLSGPSSDLENIRRVLVSSPETALFSESQFVGIMNPTSDALRAQIGTYILGRSAPGDILIFYFSGHGMPVGSSDFGFCTVDTMIHPGANAVLPLTVVKFSDLMETLLTMGVIPIIIIDACYSGTVGSAVISSNEAINMIHSEVQTSFASNYALFCSCSPIQSSLDSPQGGIFSRILFEVLGNGVSSLQRGTDIVSIKDIYRPVMELIERNAFEATPRLYLGETFSDFPIARNVLYSPQTYSFVGHLKRIVEELWHNGNDRELSPREILDLCGSGAYGNHQKLSLNPWMLVENSPGSKKRRLTERGRLFVQGKLQIPKTIEKDPNSDAWRPTSNSVMVSIDTA